MTAKGRMTPDERAETLADLREIEGHYVKVCDSAWWGNRRYVELRDSLRRAIAELEDAQ